MKNVINIAVILIQKFHELVLFTVSTTISSRIISKEIEVSR